MKSNPTFLDLENVREEIARWDPDKDEVERLMQGLQKAGLKYGTKHGAADSAATEIEPQPKSDTAGGWPTARDLSLCKRRRLVMNRPAASLGRLV
jgi:hypothetical protein